MDNIIEALKQNEKPLGLMSEEMQAKAKELGIRKMSHYTRNVDGDYQFLHWCARQNADFRTDETYQLPDHYTEPEPEAGVEKCEVKKQGDHLHYRSAGTWGSLYDVVNRQDFIGLEKDGWRWGYAGNLYVNKLSGNACLAINIADAGQYDIITPEGGNVLFRKQ